MCGIFGIISERKIPFENFKKLALISRQRGRDSSGFLTIGKEFKIRKFDKDIKKTVNFLRNEDFNIAIGHTRLITNSTKDNQPVLSDNISVVHNGIIINHEELFEKIGQKRNLEIDTEILPVLINFYLKKNLKYEEIISNVLDLCIGTVSCCAVIPKNGKILLFSNNGSLYLGNKSSEIFFASEKNFLNEIGCKNINKIKNHVIDIRKYLKEISIIDENKRKNDLVPKLLKSSSDENLLIFNENNLKRCSKCILPSTMPFIEFDEKGECNYCKNYSPKNIKKYNRHDFIKFFKKYEDSNGTIDCIVPLSGGRDSCIALHLAKEELNFNPIAYTYDWGVVTDLARRNISRMCHKLNVEHIIFADDISKKRQYIKSNVLAWLKKPHLGMVNIFTAGDKHFFRHIENLKRKTNINLDLWGINPYEVTHFKSGFLGIPPDFYNEKVYSSGFSKQISYQSKRFFQMIKNPAYLNFSIFDNLYGEYYRSINKRSDHYSIFDFWKWDEQEVEKILSYYNWEKATDTNSTWRIGDGVAAFYNYIYYTCAGFTEHDTFRSNQIREGAITRTEALKLVKDENKPRLQNIKWFLEIIGLEFKDTIERINKFKYINKAI